MSLFNFSQQVVLVTGGTRGIGLETALAFARYGAKCVLTYRWGDHDEAEINRAFTEINASTPLIIQANAGDAKDTDKLMSDLEKQMSQIDILISNVSLAPIIRSFEDYSLKGLQQSISYSSWPMVGYIQKIHQTFGKYPKYVIGMSSTGPDSYTYGYDFVAASKAALEVLCRYLSYRLRDEPTVINIIRSQAIKTQSLRDTFGEDLEPFIKKFVPDNYWIEPIEIAKAAVALCSGYCDAINGQTITVDRGTSFFHNFMDMYTRARKGELDVDFGDYKGQ